MSTLPEITGILHGLYGIDPDKAQAASRTFLENLKWDPAFMLKLIGLSFHELGDISHANKACLLDEITKLLRRYQEMPELEKKIEN